VDVEARSRIPTGLKNAMRRRMITPAMVIIITMGMLTVMSTAMIIIIITVTIIIAMAWRAMAPIRSITAPDWRAFMRPA
jgi:hypothetical protein